MAASPPICEIRLPTYRRPKLLRRALHSVAAQTYPHWRCIVFDDCADGSARAMVDELADTRFIYCRNEAPKGAIGNIDQCFRNKPYADGHCAFLLEDDNFILPGHIEANLALCAKWSVELVMSGQACEEVVVPGEPGRLTETKTIVWIYPEGLLAPSEVLAAILFSHAFSNGSLFWRIGCKSDFEMGGLTRRPGIQELSLIHI